MSWIELLRQGFENEADRIDTDYATDVPPQGFAAYDLAGGFVQILTDLGLARVGSKLMRCHVDAVVTAWAALQYFGYAGSGQVTPPTLRYKGNRATWWNRLEPPLPSVWTEYTLFWFYHEGKTLAGEWRGTIQSMVVRVGNRGGLGVELSRMWMDGSLQGAWIPLPDLGDMDWHLFDCRYLRDPFVGYYEFLVDGVRKFYLTGNTVEFPRPSEGISEVYAMRGYEIGPWGARNRAATVLIDEIVTEGIPVSGGRRIRVAANAFTGGVLRRTV